MRRVAFVAALVVVLAACGSGSSGSGSADAQVTFTPDPLRTGSVTFTVTVTNDTTKALELDFPNGQRADVTLSKDGAVVYQWSRGIMFTQSVGTDVVPAGGNKAFTLEAPAFDVPAGTYSLHAVVTASNHTDLGVTRQVTVRSN
jgi:intracellular proteinase inhibitor BsuPI